MWHIGLDAPPARVQAAALWLSPDERQRSQRFHFERDRRRFMVSHAAVRIILGRYLQVAGHRVAYTVQEFGKPSLAGLPSDSGLRFNLSHAHELAVLAVTWQREVGVDVEQVRPLPDMMEIAARFFAPPEVQQLQNVPTSAGQIQAFFNCWTRKEAFIKAIGSGLHHPLDSFAVTLLPHESPRLCALPGQPDLCAGWSLHAWEPAPGYCAALVVQGELPVCVVHDFDPAGLTT